MGKQYWIRQPGNPKTYGPYEADQVRTFASEGRLPPDGQVSEDQANWHPASAIKGLFAGSAPALSAAPAVQPVSYYSGFSAGAGVPGKQRNVIPFSISAVLMTASGIGSALLFRQIVGARVPDMSLMNYILGGSCLYLICALLCLIFWLIWVHQVHEDMRNFAGQQYPISPGQAVGYSFIPVFNAVWAIYMPWRLARQTSDLLQGQGKPFSPAPVLIFQILSVLGVIFYLTPLFYAATMIYLQSGLNRVWRTATAAPIALPVAS